jgi:hypothetical protein
LGLQEGRERQELRSEGREIEAEGPMQSERARRLTSGISGERSESAACRG